MDSVLFFFLAFRFQLFPDLMEPDCLFPFFHSFPCPIGDDPGLVIQGAIRIGAVILADITADIPSFIHEEPALTPTFHSVRYLVVAGEFPVGVPSRPFLLGHTVLL